jgi:hypothetical protein
MFNGDGFDGVDDSFVFLWPIKNNPMKVECLMVPWMALGRALS